MSLGYAEKLSWREDLGGQLGAKESFDSPADLERKLDELADLVRESRRVIVFTGAGISTSCGIPDFRGPNGVWTAQAAGRPLPKATVSFAAARPSLTHQALLALHQAGKVSFIVSQNVDCLHLRSSVPRAALAELHGNCFAERCGRCRTEVLRDFEIETVGFKLTGRKCARPGCRGGALRDAVLDWEDALPEDELQASEREADAADLALCIGTSLQISPSCNLPLRTVRAGGKLAIVNLQATPKDKRAALLVRARADAVMAGLLRRLQLPIRAYRRSDAVTLACCVTPAAGVGRKRKAQDEAGEAAVQLVVAGRHGDAAHPQPMLASARVTFLEPAGLKPGELRAPPFALQRSVRLPCRMRVRVRLTLAEAADADKRSVQLSEAWELPGEAGEQRQHTFLTQVVEYDCAVKAEAKAEAKAA